MTPERWLCAALHNLAPDVRRRLEAEYREHIRGALDAGEAGEEVLAALGDPEALNRELLATHLSEYEAKVLAGRTQRWTARTAWAPPLLGLAASGMAALLGAEDARALPWLALPPLVGALLSGMLVWWRGRWTILEAALYSSPALRFALLIVWATGQGLIGAPSWPRVLGFVVGVGLLFAFAEAWTHGPLYRKARAGRGVA